MNKGIAIAGNLVMDVQKQISDFPTRHGLVTIKSIENSLGGAVCNCIRDLAALDEQLPLTAIGLVGPDTEGDEMVKGLDAYPNVKVRVGREGRTSVTDVLNEERGKARTFLHYRGSNALLSEEHFHLDDLECDLLHVGYILLLDQLDAPDEVYGTKMARLLHNAQQRGIRTSVDVVSEVGDRYQTLVPPSLKYADYCIINEIEAGKTCGIPLRDEQENLLMDRIPQVCRALKEMGVRRWVVLHAPEGGFGMDEVGNYVALPSLKLPEGFIKGTVGAGDAFCSGVLYSAYMGEDLRQAIDDGIASAACSLSELGASEGMRPIDQVRKLAASMERRSF